MGRMGIALFQGGRGYFLFNICSAIAFRSCFLLIQRSFGLSMMLNVRYAFSHD